MALNIKCGKQLMTTFYSHSLYASKLLEKSRYNKYMKYLDYVV
jgi:hypothetical protein